VVVTQRAAQTRARRRARARSLGVDDDGTGWHGHPPGFLRAANTWKWLTPTNPLVMWGLHELQRSPLDVSRKKYLMLRQDPKATTPQKVALFNPENLRRFTLLGSDLFIKRYTPIKGGHFPDMGSSYETFTNADFLELETVGPLVNLAPGALTEHVEPVGALSQHQTERPGNDTETRSCACCRSCN